MTIGSDRRPKVLSADNTFHLRAVDSAIPIKYAQQWPGLSTLLDKGFGFQASDKLAKRGALTCSFPKPFARGSRLSRGTSLESVVI